MKRLAISCWLLAVSVWCGSAAATDARYWDPSERMPKEVNVDTVTATTRSISNGWYAVEGKITIDGTLALEGDVNLILADNAELAINGGKVQATGGNGGRGANGWKGDDGDGAVVYNGQCRDTSGGGGNGRDGGDGALGGSGA